MEDLSERKDVRARAKRAKKSQEDQSGVLRVVMGTEAGRRWIWDTLSACRSFAIEVPTDAVVMAFRNGERNAGLRLLSEVMAAAPQDFMLMMQEANGLEHGGSSGSDDSDSGFDGDPPPVE